MARMGSARDTVAEATLAPPPIGERVSERLTLAVSEEYLRAILLQPRLIQFVEIAHNGTGKALRFLRWYLPLWLVENTSKWIRVLVTNWFPEAKGGLPWIPEANETGSPKEREITHQAMGNLATTNPFFSLMEILRFILTIRSAEETRVLEVGCGSGVIFAIATGFLAPEGAYGWLIKLLRKVFYRKDHLVHYVGVDPHLDAIQKILGKAGILPGRKIQKGPISVRVDLIDKPLEEANLDGPYNLVVALKAFHHLSIDDLKKLSSLTNCIFITDCGGWINLLVELLVLRKSHPVFWGDAMASEINHRKAMVLLKNCAELRKQLRIVRGPFLTYIFSA